MQKINITVQCTKCLSKYIVRLEDEKQIQFHRCSQCGADIKKYESPRDRKPLENFKPPGNRGPKR